MIGVALFFLGMGLVGLVTPERISATFGQHALTPEGRNEIRAVYGGFGVAIAVLLWWTSGDPVVGAAMALAVAVALLGMAGGRLVSAVVERPGGFYPSWFYFVVEIGLASVLLATRA